MRRIQTDADIVAALDALAADPRLAACRAAVQGVPLRIIPAGLEGLLRIVASQQLSTQSANAVWARFAIAFNPLTPEAILSASDDELRAAGLSRQKTKTFRAVAAAVAAGLDLEGVGEIDPDDARAALEAINGIGRWTADLYLMFAAGHPDIFPVGDLAVRKSAQRALSLAEEPKPEALALIAEAWSPHRSTAARLLWAFYRVPPAGEATFVPV